MLCFIILINVFNILSVGVNSLYKFIYFILYMTLTCKLPTLNKELIIIIVLEIQDVGAVFDIIF